MRNLVRLAFELAVRVLLPPTFERDFGPEIRALFASRLRGAHGAWPVLRVVVLELGDVIRTAGREWWNVWSEGSTRTNRDAGGRGMTGTWMELRTAARSLIRRPRFTLGVGLTLSLGIAATTTIFSVVDGILLRPLPYDAASRMITLGAVAADRPWADETQGLQNLERMPWWTYQRIGERATTLASTAAIEPSLHILPDMGDGPVLVPVARVTPSFFELLEVRPLLGRSFVPEEYSTASERVVVITYGAWQRRFGGDPEVVGRTPPAGGATIVGVLPIEYRPLEAFFAEDDEPEFFGPIPMDHERFATSPPRVFAIGRMAEGVSVAVARLELEALARSIAAESPETALNPDRSPPVVGANGLHAQTVGSSGRTIYLFFAAALGLLLIATLNVATLLLARGLDRARDVSIRMALGASRSRVAWGALSEGLLLAVLGGALGGGLAYGGVGAFRRLAPASLPRVSDVVVDGRVLAAAAGVAIVAGLIAGLLPALSATTRRTSNRAGPLDSAASRRSTILRSGLVGGQIALAVVLLTGAGLLLASFVQIRSADLGFEPTGVVAMSENVEVLGRVHFMRGEPVGELGLWQLWDEVVDAMAAVPGVEFAGAASSLPFQRSSWSPGVVLAGDDGDRIRQGIVSYVVTPGYLEALGTDVVEGRSFTRLDSPDSEPVALVNETFARIYFGGAAGVDRTLTLVDRSERRQLRIVGVVEDVVQTRVQDGVEPALYVPYTQKPWPILHAVARSSLPAETFIPELRAVARSYNAILPARDQRPMSDAVARSFIAPRFQSYLLSAFAAVATLLAAVGLFGSMSHLVATRRREIGVRMAIGATRSGVVRMVLRDGMLVAGVGLLVGIVGARATARFFGGLLYEISATDAGVALGSVAVLALVSATACVAPAHRAATVDPATALEAE